MIIISLDYAMTLDPLDADNPLIGYINLANEGSVTSSTEAEYFPLLNLFDPTTFQYWMGTAASSTETITFTGSGEEIDYIAFAVHNFGSSKRKITITGTLDGSPVTLVGESYITSDEPLLFRFVKGDYSEIVITLSAAPDGVTVPQAAVLYIGELLVVPRKIYVGHTPINYGRQSNVIVGRSVSGNYLGRLVLGEKLKTTVEFQYLDPGWYREHFEPFKMHAIEGAFFFAWRPNSYPKEIGYCWTVNDIIPVNQLANGMMQLSMELEGVA